jgi:hypothetical protein
MRPTDPRRWSGRRIYRNVLRASLEHIGTGKLHYDPTNAGLAPRGITRKSPGPSQWGAFYLHCRVLWPGRFFSSERQQTSAARQ